MDKYSDEQLRDFAMRVAWELMTIEDQENMRRIACASLQTAEMLGIGVIASEMFKSGA